VASAHRSRLGTDRPPLQSSTRQGTRRGSGHSRAGPTDTLLVRLGVDTAGQVVPFAVYQVPDRADATADQAGRDAAPRCPKAERMAVENYRPAVVATPTAPADERRVRGLVEIPDAGQPEEQLHRETRDRCRWQRPHGGGGDAERDVEPIRLQIATDDLVGRTLCGVPGPSSGQGCRAEDRTRSRGREGDQRRQGTHESRASRPRR
jgi:hypothetical protein